MPTTNPTITCLVALINLKRLNPPKIWILKGCRPKAALDKSRRLQAELVACRALPQHPRQALQVTQILCIPVWGSVHLQQINRPSPNHFKATKWTLWNQHKALPNNCQRCRSLQAVDIKSSNLRDQHLIICKDPCPARVKAHKHWH